ncbi:DUF6194 family protein [Streptomyces sp. NPDC048416]|uniref:DUF6194 family protein n=1 Tax=Streptomyces sp. NPDC048416 TaxID=3365546 RepID=UPI003711C96E
MSIEQIIAIVRDLDGALVVVPEPGDGSPELAWGDAFFYYAPDGRMPRNGQPYGTIVTKDHPGDTASRLGLPGRRRVNVHVDRATFRELTGGERSLAGEERGGSGEERGGACGAHDYAAVDRVMPHPVYGALGWVCVVNPAERTTDTVVRLLRGAHEAARARAARRREPGPA